MKNRSNLIAAARDGDEEAMESLTMEDMDTYSMISQRIATEDLFSIVESYFMPYGIQCDQYSILGEILDVHTFKNILTGEELYRLTVPISEVDMIRVKIGTVTKAKPLENSDANVYATADFIPSDGRLFQKMFFNVFCHYSSAPSLLETIDP